MLKIRDFLILISLGLAAGCQGGTAVGKVSGDGGQAPVRVRHFTYEVINSWPHDADAFTQGLVWHDGELYESTGLNGKSSVRRVDLRTGQVLQKRDVPSQYFAEGLAVVGDAAYQLTWLSQFGYVYDLRSFDVRRTFNYTGEGWGLTFDGQSLIMSDGSNRIRFLSPDNFELQRAISVYDGSNPINRLNELEYIGGEIWANIWQSDRIVIIEPHGGRVTGWLDLKGLLKPEDRTGPVDVLNGIAWDETGKRLFVTGKLWPKLYEVRIIQPRNTLSRQ